MRIPQWQNTLLQPVIYELTYWLISELAIADHVIFAAVQEGKISNQQKEKRSCQSEYFRSGKRSQELAMLFYQNCAKSSVRSGGNE